MHTAQLTQPSDIEATTFIGKPCKKCGSLIRKIKTKRCVACHKVLQASWYKNNKQQHDARTVQWRKNNPDTVLEYSRNYHENNKERSREYYKINKSKINVQSSLWKTQNKDKVVAYTAKGRARKLRANPYPEFNWVNKFFYQEAKTLEQITGYKWHVDHIVPLQGKTVCGLHVPWNLQTIPANDNLSKSNIFMSN
jgi:hypothetical protein